MASSSGSTRRQFLGALGVAAAATRCATPTGGSGAAPAGKQGEQESEVAPGEDLMREHGVLRRIMFVYDEAIHRLEGPEELPPEVLVSAAGIIRRVIEDYHEKLEEQFLFPRFEKAGEQKQLVAVLRQQHQVGRGVTDNIVHLAKGSLRDDANRRQLAAALRSFNRMYRPHAAREDTVLFPAFHELVGEKAYAELGEQFEDREKAVLGKDGFEGAVAEVARLEAALGLQDLAKFTP